MKDEIISKIKKCKTIDEVKKLNEKENLSLTDKDFEFINFYINEQKDLSNEELANVSAGEATHSCNNSDDTPYFSVGEICTVTGARVRIDSIYPKKELISYTIGDYYQWKYDVTYVEDNEYCTYIDYGTKKTYYEFEIRKYNGKRG